jgi:hypothetical protein
MNAGEPPRGAALHFTQGIYTLVEGCFDVSLTRCQVWMLDMKTMAWRAGPSVNRIERFFPWSGRYLHQAAIVGHEMWVVGGRNILRDDQYLLCDVVGALTLPPACAPLSSEQPA